jgi:hypothetical protein
LKIAKIIAREFQNIEEIILSEIEAPPNINKQLLYLGLKFLQKKLKKKKIII